MNKKESKKVFGQNLKRLRLERGMSQDELAKALGYTNRSSINKIEVGRSSVPTEKITLLAQILNVSPLELFRDDSEPVITISDKPPFKVDFSVQRFLMRSMAAYQEAEEPVGFPVAVADEGVASLAAGAAIVDGAAVVEIVAVRFGV